MQREDDHGDHHEKDMQGLVGPKGETKGRRGS